MFTKNTMNRGMGSIAPVETGQGYRGFFRDRNIIDSNVIEVPIMMSIVIDIMSIMIAVVVAAVVNRPLAI